jgi:hypothetical protein
MMRKIVKPFLFRLFILISLSIGGAYSQNILTNGDFESGGSGVGFMAGGFPAYSLATITGTSVPGNYSFVTDPSLMNSSFISGDTIFMNLNWVTLPFLRFTNLFKK